MPLFEVAIIRKAKEQRRETLVLPPKAILADSEKAAIALAGREIDVGANVPLDLIDCEVLVRPFK